MAIRLGHWLQGVFNTNGIKRVLKKIPKPTKALIHIGIGVVEVLKRVMDNPVLSFVTELTATDVDNKALAGAKEWLPKILLEMKIADKCLSLTDPDDIVRCAAEAINQLAGDFKSQKLTAIAEFSTVAASDGKITWDEIAGLVKIVFDHEYKAEEETDQPEA